MPIARLKSDATALLVIDVQERLLPTIHRADRLVNNCAVLCRMAGVLGVPVVATERYVQGLGHTAPDVRSALPVGSLVVTKTQFSALTNDVRIALRTLNRPTVIV